MKLRVALFVWSFPLVASAQANVAVAEKLFREAQDAMKTGNYAEACTKFDASNRADPQLGTLLNLAACREKEGKPATAWAAYTTLIDLAGRAGDKDRVEYARKRAAALEPTLPQLKIRVPSGVSLTDVKLDDQPLASSALATTIPIDPGAHTLALSTGAKRWTESVTIAPSGTTTLDVHVPPDIVVTQPELPPTTRPVETSKSSGARTVGLVLGGVGLGAVVAGGVFGGVALGYKSQVDAGCNGAACSPSAYDASVAARTTGWVSTVSFIAGGVLVATGLVLYFVGAPKKAAPIVALLTGQGHFP